jgi:bacterioferritin
MTDQEVVALLNHDMTMEHQAIVQYLLSAWGTGGELASSIEGIARDEMRHFKWFAQIVVSLGGNPTTERAPVERTNDPVAFIQANINAEDGAVATYRQHREAIPYENIKKLFDRIISEEQHHGEKFRAMVPKVEGMPPIEYHAPQTPQEKLLYRYLEEDVSGEYAAILRYLHQSFVVKDGWLSKALEDRAIDEMKHMGWMAEHKAEAGGEPEANPDQIRLSTDLKEIFAGNVKLEQDAEARYQRHIDGYDDPDLQKLWAFIQYQEQHHTDEFQTRLREQLESEKTAQAGEPSPKPKTPSSSVGSLFRIPQK